MAFWRPAPSLYDLHHPDGALANIGKVELAAFDYRQPIFSVLEKAGYDVEPLPEDKRENWGRLKMAGQDILTINPDRTLVELPKSFQRWSLPHESGLISMRVDGQTRVTDGQSMSTPIGRGSDLATFADHYLRSYGSSQNPKDTQPPSVGSLHRAELLADGIFQIGEEKLDAAAFVERAISESSNLFVIYPQPEAQYGAFVEMLAMIYEKTENPTSVQLGAALDPNRPPRLLTLRSGPMAGSTFALKVDRGTPWNIFGKYFTHLSERVTDLALLTALDLSDTERLKEATVLPGGLIGGLQITLGTELTLENAEI